MTPSPFSTIILGGTGQVGGAAVDELLAIPQCREVVMVTRKAIAPKDRVRNVVLDTGAADLPRASRRSLSRCWRRVTRVR